jgi:urease accessory protein UreE
LTVVDRVHHESDLTPAHGAFNRDTLTLGWEERARAHAARRTDGGVEFGLSLPRGTILAEGDCLVLEAERLIVRVVERLEPVFVVEPRTPEEWALYAYHIGNRHQPLMVADGALVCPDIAGVEQLLQQHRMPYRRDTRRFTPAATVAGHSH